MYRQRKTGFTVVELLVVILVIVVLALISLVGYSSAAGRGRDAQRRNDINAIMKGLELYHQDKGSYPIITGGSTIINQNWATTNDASWAKLEEALVPKYMDKLPMDPDPSTKNPQTAGNNGYAYWGAISSYWCGTTAGQMYVLVYNLEVEDKETRFRGDCKGSYVLTYNTSMVRVVE